MCIDINRHKGFVDSLENKLSAKVVTFVQIWATLRVKLVISYCVTDPQVYVDHL